MPTLDYQWQRESEDGYVDVDGATDSTIVLDEFGIFNGCIRLQVVLHEVGCDDIPYTVGPICIPEHAMAGIQVEVLDEEDVPHLEVGYPTRHDGFPNDIVWNPGRALYYVSSPEGADPAGLTKLDGAGFTQFVPVESGSFPGPMFVDGDTIWIANVTGGGGFGVMAFDTISETWENFAPGQSAVAIVFTNSLAWFIDSDELYTIDPGTGVVTPMGLSAELVDARDMVLDASNRIWISNYAAAYVTVWRIADDAFDNYTTTADHNLGLAFAFGQGMFIATDTNILRLIDNLGSTVFDLPLGGGWSANPYSISWDEEDQVLWMAKRVGQWVRRYNQSGTTYDAHPYDNPPTEDVDSPHVEAGVKGILAVGGGLAFVLGGVNGDGLVSVMQYT